ncbi:hypothetical protein A2617_03835 [Candidatus Daviesbacteria bacterium RIFOXYD1_FULL_41_10]|uniref:Uncharacterized protein n=2 Tax=Candidatus Daviesiibacteriota TaxID=1752718 RepID=A0A1F5MZZ4_9BACT|nr:MAG: hypothetical protein UU67_C0003G0019 [Candidatus Daviesbacteria bacterium GW2011_GWB1_41_5]OGE70948.1 MAG: hypothetical protein A2617_03835 [Candidatus Daviesbacteria bacterium RIFOXYD1_FULL_41_10]
MSKPKIDRNINISDDLIKKFLTDSEWRMVKQRFLISNLLSDGLSVRKIAERVKVGTDTVVRVAKMVKKSGNSGSKPQNIKTSTPWIFGKSD